MKIDIKNPRMIISWVIFLLPFYVFAQKVNFEVSLKDSIQALSSVQVLLIPYDQEAETLSVKTNSLGQVNIKVDKNTNYDVWISPFGYVSLNEDLEVKDKDFKKTYVFQKEENTIDEVVYKMSPPIIVKQDTTVYKASYFSSGTELRLKDLIKKMPGLQVDNKGNALFKGQKISQLQIEDKPFFGQGTSLGLKHIPANAVSKVEIIEDYNAVSFMKNTDKKGTIIMNLKLKEDKKDIYFGDAEASINSSDNYYGHLNLFKISPKFNLYNIANLNNINASPFSFENYREFQGGIMADKDLSNLSSRALRSLMNRSNFQSIEDKFLASNIRSDLSSKTTLSGFAVFHLQDKNYRSSENRSYLQSDLEEELIKQADYKNFIHLGNLKLTHRPKENQQLDAELNYQWANNEKQNKEHSDLLDNVIENQEESPKFIQLMARYRQKVNAKYKRDIHYTSYYNETENQQDWQSESPFLSDYISWDNSNDYYLNQGVKKDLFYNKIEFKNYIDLGNVHQLQAFVSYTNSQNNRSVLLDENLGNQDLEARDNQKDNRWKATVYHRFLWNRLEVKYGGDLQLTNRFFNANKNSYFQWLPMLEMKYENKKKQRINLSYHYKDELPSFENLTENKTVLSRYQINGGNSLLKAQKYHDFKTRLSFRIWKSIRSYWTLRYKNYEQYSLFTNDYSGLSQFTSLAMGSQKSDFESAVMFSKYNKYYNGNLTLRYSENKQEIYSNESLVNRLDKNHYLALNTGTNFKEIPNFKLDLTASFSSLFQENRSDFKTQNYSAEIGVDHVFFDNLVAKIKYKTQWYYNLGTSLSDKRNYLDIDLEYRIPKTAWNVNLRYHNILGEEELYTSSQNEILFNERRVYQQPKVFLLSLLYRF